MRFQQSVGSKLLLAFGAVIALPGAAIALSILRLADFNSAVAAVTGPQLQKLEIANAWIYELQETARHTRNMLILDDKEKLREEIQAVEDNKSRRQEYRETLLHRVDSDEEKRALQAVVDARGAYVPLEAGYLQQVAAGQIAQARTTLLDKVRPAQVEYVTTLRNFIEFQKRHIAAQAADLSVSYKRSLVWVVLMALVAFAAGGIIAVKMGNAIRRPLEQVVDVFKKMSEGRLDNRISTDRVDEIGQVQHGLNDLQARLRSLIAENQGQLEAIGKVQAVIEFDLDGNVCSANDLFLQALGYSLEEIKGRHHSMFVSPAERSSEAYRLFWEKLRRGEFDKGRYLRHGKADRKVWIDASYNPIPGPDGKPYRVVKYANDVTQHVLAAQAMERAVAQTQEVVKSACDGNLTVRVAEGDKDGPLRRMAESINALLQNMAEVVGKVKAAANEVYSGATEISQGNANLSQRTEEQSSSLEETASSMEEMTATVKQNANNADQANQLATAARGQAERGGAVTADAVRGMAEINEASKRIADIIGVIDEIAFQTNLLALNAAVEAARAGEQGRGFAVVASEVRTLASRSAAAAKEIKDLIQDSVKKVEDGTQLVSRSGQTLSEIVLSVKKVSDIVAEIAAASREQSAGIDQVNKAVSQMDQMTQQNAALVEEAAAASNAVADQARTLTALMEGYRVAADGSAQHPPAQAPVVARLERRAAGRPWSGRGHGESTA
jgi:methyl-accepting chemotaxis protein